MKRSARTRIQLGIVFFLVFPLLALPLVLAAEAGPAGPSQKVDAPAKADAAKKGGEHYTLTAVEINGTKFWLPSTIIVPKGAAVELKLVNKLDAPHGFAMDAFNIREEVPAGGSVTVRFTAKQPGTYSYYCQLHAPHIGGQILVQP